MPQLDELAERIFTAVKGYVDSARVSLNARIDALPTPKDGTDGKDGADGKSVSEEELLAFIGQLVKQEMAALPKPENGKDAELDLDVLKEVLADVVPPLLVSGPAGADGEPGPPGPPGQDGVEGQDGKPGADGRDALDIEPLPAIDGERSYARGTWACHAGGLVRAARATDPLANASLFDAGWAVMVAGLSDVIIMHGSDERSFAIVTHKTGGELSRHEFVLPALIYRGIWEPVRKYERGDVVTRDGSMWHAEEAGSQSEPGLPGSIWKLVVKRGAQGQPAPAARAPQEPVRVR